jgi:mitochondrial fission protein ELM1
VWGLLDDRLGHARQVEGVVAALGGGRLIRLRYDRPLRRPDLLAPATVAHLAATSRAELEPPWPRVAVAAGRRTAAVLRWLKARAGANLFAVLLMRPARLAEFDLVAVPAHDRAPTDPRVVVTLGAPHPFDRAALDRARGALPAKAASLPPPYLTVLVGGPTRGVAFGLDDVDRLAAAVDAFAGDLGASVLATTSPRSPGGAAPRLARRLTVPHLVHDVAGAGPNPLRTFLGAAQRIVVTADSASMLSEAAAAGVPVHLFDVRGGRPKFARLQAALTEAGVIQPWVTDVAAPPAPVDESARLAAIIRERCGIQPPSRAR